MNTPETVHGNHTSQQIDHAIVEAIRGCNHNVSSADIVTYLIGNTYNQHAYKMGTQAKRLFTRRINEKMAVYPIANKNSKYTVWRVK